MLYWVNQSFWPHSSGPIAQIFVAHKYADIWPRSSKYFKGHTDFGYLMNTSLNMYTFKVNYGVK